jgi:hypothetical protein
MAATLKITARPDLAAGARAFTVDCPHGTTRALLLPGATVLLDDQIVRGLLARHDTEEHCRCTRRLWRRYGAAGVPG